MSSIANSCKDHRTVVAAASAPKQHRCAVGTDHKTIPPPSAVAGRYFAGVSLRVQSEMCW